ncbi:hypothetical protein HPNQ4216_1509 [Helicobacter pylori NQ4216]|nr:hypothetical protein HPNQ4216_1509 [Helicobacter pylori NQ4216]
MWNSLFKGFLLKPFFFLEGFNFFEAFVFEFSFFKPFFLGGLM